MAFEVSNFRLGCCMLIKGLQVDLFFKNELVYVQCIRIAAKGGGQVSSSITHGKAFLIISEMHSARLSKMPLAVAATIHHFLAFECFVFEKRSPCGPLQLINFYHAIS